MHAKLSTSYAKELVDQSQPQEIPIGIIEEHLPDLLQLTTSTAVSHVICQGSKFVLWRSDQNLDLPQQDSC
eukprot:scaffold6861_cov248-Ochromonas_danica.AAC.16